ncbi:MAG: aspartate/methionine/tyrosine aminotransferase [Bacteroidia bacterium]|jgi:aspartate/methionine/tyrosine aminotransferase
MKSKLPRATDSIFAIMSKMAADRKAINLSQGFPNFESDPILIELVCKAMKDGHNQYVPMPGDVKLPSLHCTKHTFVFLPTHEATAEKNEKLFSPSIK